MMIVDLAHPILMRKFDIYIVLHCFEYVYKIINNFYDYIICGYHIVNRIAFN